jgi:hypothetical protein
MTPPHTELSKEECDGIVAHLDGCIAILDRNTGRRSLPQIRLRSMLAVLRGELLKSDLSHMTVPPFSLNPLEKR